MQEGLPALYSCPRLPTEVSFRGVEIPGGGSGGGEGVGKA